MGRTLDHSRSQVGRWSAIGLAFFGFVTFVSPPVFAGVDVWTSVGPDDASLFAVAVDPVTPNTVYVGTDNGGVFKSTNGGSTWTSIGLDSTDVLALAIDPTAPNTIYAGTNGFGVFKSTDGGGTWNAVNNGLTASTVRVLTIDASNPSTVYAGSLFGGGLFKTTNGGASWAAINSGFAASSARAIKIHPSTPTTVYVGASGSGGGVYVSTNGGSSWTLANNGLTTTDVLSLAADPSGALYAGTSGGGVFKSTNAAASWSQVNTGLTATSIRAIVIDPSAPTTVYAGTNAGMYKTTNGAANWAGVSMGLVDGFLPLPIAVVAIDPATPSTLYAGTATNGGVFKSSNAAASWSPSHNGLANAFVTSIAIDDAFGDLYAATPDDGIFRSTDFGTTWLRIDSGLGDRSVFTLALDETTTVDLYAGTYSGVYKTTNGGGSWASANSGLPSNSADRRVYALAIDPVTPTTLYAGLTLNNSTGRVYKSINSATSWVDTGLSAPSSVNAIVVDPDAPSTVYVGTYAGVFKTTNGGTSWTSMNVGLTEITVQSLALEIGNSSTVYAGTLYGGVFKSTEGAASWTSANNGLPPTEISAFATNPFAPGPLYAATSAGVFQSTDGAANWFPIHDGFPFASAESLAIGYPAVLYAGTGGRSIFSIEPVPRPTPTATATATSTAPTPTPTPTSTGPTATSTPPTCPETDLGSSLPISQSGSTGGGANLFAGSCGGGTSPERTFRYTAPAAGTYVIGTVDAGTAYDTVVYVRDGGTCGGSELTSGCNDDWPPGIQSQVSVTLAAGQTINVFVDGFGGQSGAFVLHIAAAPTPTPTATPIPPCPATPQSCRTPFVGGKAFLSLTNKTPHDKNQFQWKWSAGSATAKADFGDPLNADDYVLCLYDGVGLLATLIAPVGDMCGTKPCWADKTKGYQYKDKAATPSGITQLQLSEGGDGKAKIQLKGKGVNLPDIDLTAITSPLTVQLERSGGGVCFGATYTFPPATKNDGVSFKDKAD